MRLLRISFVALILSSGPSVANPQLIGDLQTLTSPPFLGRESGSLEPNQSAQYLYTRLSESGYKPQIQSFDFQAGWSASQRGHNVLAVLPCQKNPCLPSIIITAHYDHLGGIESRYYPGANDNASGVAALLFLADRLKQQQTNRDIIFLATDAEEKGLFGSHYYTSNVPLENIGLNINLDMLAVNKKRTLYVLSSRHSGYEQIVHQLAPRNIKFRYTESAKRLGKWTDTPRTDWLRASDHYPFFKQGIPFLYIGMGEDEKHHSVKDTFQNVDVDAYQDAVYAVSELIDSIVAPQVDT